MFKKNVSKDARCAATSFSCAIFSSSDKKILVDFVFNSRSKLGGIFANLIQKRKTVILENQLATGGFNPKASGS